MDDKHNEALDFWSNFEKSVSRTVRNITDSGRVEEEEEPDDGGKQLSISVCTWNVGSSHAAVKDPGIHAWLCAGRQAPTDVHIVALQEVLDLASPVSYVKNPIGGLLANPVGGLLGSNPPVGEVSGEATLWDATLRKALPSHVLVARKQLVGIVLFVFVAQEHAEACTSARVTQLGTGLLGAGNKGAVAASLALYGSTVCVVCAHLAAGTKGPAARNKDAASIRANLTFPPHSATVSPDFGVEAEPTTMAEHDFVLWAGDLNYRIAMADTRVRSLVAERAWGPLLEADELLMSQASGAAFVGFGEATINFAPTYKYDLHGNSYDTSPKRRTPAWTDRVLWRPALSADIRCVRYERHDLRGSDHRPVSALLELGAQPVSSPVRMRNAAIRASQAAPPPPPNLCVAFANCLATHNCAVPCMPTAAAPTWPKAYAPLK